MVVKRLPWLLKGCLWRTAHQVHGTREEGGTVEEYWGGGRYWGRVLGRKKCCGRVLRRREVLAPEVRGIQ